MKREIGFAMFPLLSKRCQYYSSTKMWKAASPSKSPLIAREQVRCSCYWRFLWNPVWKLMSSIEEEESGKMVLTTQHTLPPGLWVVKTWPPWTVMMSRNRIVESLYCTPETHITLYVNLLEFKLKIFKRIFKNFRKRVEGQLHILLLSLKFSHFSIFLMLFPSIACAVWYYRMIQFKKRMIKIWFVNTNSQFFINLFKFKCSWINQYDVEYSVLQC